MKKKIFALVMAVMMLATMLTGCIQNDIGVKMNKDGTGSISATIGIEKDFYQNLKQMGSDPFEGKTMTEYTYEDSTYVAYTEVKEYSSYEEMEKALLSMFESGGSQYVEAASMTRFASGFIKERQLKFASQGAKLLMCKKAVDKARSSFSLMRMVRLFLFWLKHLRL